MIDFVVCRDTGIPVNGRKLAENGRVPLLINTCSDTDTLLYVAQANPSTLVTSSVLVPSRNARSYQ